MKPEDILSNNALVDGFTPRDIRALTYLGYLSINGPKYKVLGKKIFKDNNLLFELQEKVSNHHIYKNADQINSDRNIINNLSPVDAKTIGYVLGSSSILGEELKIKKKEET